MQAGCLRHIPFTQTGEEPLSKNISRNTEPKNSEQEEIQRGPEQHNAKGNINSAKKPKNRRQSQKHGNSHQDILFPARETIETSGDWNKHNKRIETGLHSKRTDRPFRC